MNAYETLTRRQREIYDYLRAQRDVFEHPPTLDELCQALGMRSRGSLHKHIRALVEAGLLEPMDGKQRGVTLTTPEPEENTGALPLLGYIAAGRPIEALEIPGEIDVPEQLRGARPSFVLQVRGDSMIDEGILDGDWVVVEQRDYADSGELVVALVDNSEATLKRLEKRNGTVVLHPANAAMTAMEYTAERVRIQGVVTGQMRAYR